MPALPIELVDIIISFLPSEPITRTCGHDANYLDKSTAIQVARCALVCRSWVSSSRRVLFYKVCVTQDTAHGFFKLFRKHQRLTFLPFIRVLEFRGTIVYHPWMETVFPKIAKHLPTSIHTFIFVGAWFQITEPRLVSPNLCGITRFELFTARDLNLSETLKCIACFPVLEELKVWLSHGWYDTTMPEPCVRPAETLRSLDFTGCASERLLEWIQNSRTIVSNLRFCFPSRTTTAELLRSVTRYTASLGPSLVTLSLIFQVDPLGRVPDEAFTDFLRQNTGLRTLCIEANPSQTISLFNKASLPPSLESVRVSIGSWNYPSVWGDIDRILMPLPSLRRIEVMHNTSKAALSALFPSCVGRGVIAEDVEVENWFWS
ncbi:hypothetical protein C8R45DRAFT_82156 [Mycena sanguinolenta]|nr:hypothetical protein C8R45DRAFT_82156 [Mycena sanguinolenta]